MSVGYSVVDVGRDYARDVNIVKFSDSKAMQVATGRYAHERSKILKADIGRLALEERITMDAHDRIVKFGSAWLAAYDAEMLKALVA